MRFSANILHRRKRDKGDRRKVFQFHIVDGVADIQKFHLENEVRGTDMLVAGKVLLRSAKARKINCIKKSLERGVVPRKKRQEFRHTLRFSKGETEVAVMDEVALVVFHGIDDDVKFFCDITDDGF